MSVLIKGMEMPTSCLSCDFMMNCDNCEGYECYCTVLNRSIGYLPSSSDFLRDGVSLVHSDDRLEDCPIVPVPAHGRLIDADALAQQYVTAQEQREKDKIDYCNAFMNNGEPCTEWWCVEDMLENAPIIIPASEEGE